MEARDDLFVITGGPGSGKTTLIEALERAGYARSFEAGRGVIQDQVAIGGPALPWRDRSLFAEIMLGWELRSYRMAFQQQGPVFFDRGVPDVMGYLRLCGLVVPPHVRRAAETCRYSRHVFVTPPWREIFRQDSERRQDFGEAERTFEAMVAVYAELGYELVMVPCTPPDRRMRFVIEHTLERQT